MSKPRKPRVRNAHFIKALPQTIALNYNSISPLSLPTHHPHSSNHATPQPTSSFTNHIPSNHPNTPPWIKTHPPLRKRLCPSCVCYPKPLVLEKRKFSLNCFRARREKVFQLPKRCNPIRSDRVYCWSTHYCPRQPKKPACRTYHEWCLWNRFRLPWIAHPHCSQASGAPVGHGLGTAKITGREGTAGRGPSSSFIPTCRATLQNDRTGRQNGVCSRP